MTPESSDGLASVGTILPKGKATLLPGGFFVLEIGRSAHYGRRPPPVLRWVFKDATIDTDQPT
jgi:hypothetical protein